MIANTVIEDPPEYFNNACNFFSGTGLDYTGSYFIHNNNQKSVRIGIGIQRQVTLQGSDVNILDHEVRVGGGKQEAGFSPDKALDFLDPHTPCFFLISPDIKRSYIDSDLPQIIFTQPIAEIIFDEEFNRGTLTYAENSKGEKLGKQLLTNYSHTSNEYGHDRFSDELPSFADLARSWEREESDDSFLNRLKAASHGLQDYPTGKLVLTRAFRRQIPRNLSRFNVFRTQASNNGQYALSHFFCLDRELYSFGCSPENIFEISRNKLIVDVVAATCKSGKEPDFEQEQLISNSKQIKEHLSSLSSKEKKFSPFCVTGSLKQEYKMRVKRLRNVSHLHSRLVGELLPHIRLSNVIANIFPLLSARPEQLVPLADTEMGPHRYYGGLVGHWDESYTGCFLNIRNALIKGDLLHAKVGVAVIDESSPVSELIETEDKILGLMEAVYLSTQN